MEKWSFNVGREWAATAHSALKNGDHVAAVVGPFDEPVRRTCIRSHFVHADSKPHTAAATTMLQARSRIVVGSQMARSQALGVSELAMTPSAQ